MAAQEEHFRAFYKLWSVQCTRHNWALLNKLYGSHTLFGCPQKTIKKDFESALHSVRYLVPTADSDGSFFFVWSLCVVHRKREVWIDTLSLWFCQGHTAAKRSLFLKMRTSKIILAPRWYPLLISCSLLTPLNQIYIIVYRVWFFSWSCTRLIFRVNSCKYVL